MFVRRDFIVRRMKNFLWYWITSILCNSFVASFVWKKIISFQQYPWMNDCLVFGWKFICYQLYIRGGKWRRTSGQPTIMNPLSFPFGLQCRPTWSSAFLCSFMMECNALVVLFGTSDFCTVWFLLRFFTSIAGSVLKSWLQWKREQLHIEGITSNTFLIDLTNLVSDILARTFIW